MKLIVDCVTSNEYPDKLSIGGLLRMKKVDPVPWLVVGINKTFYHHNEFEETYLHDGDIVDLVYVQGGG